jgi:hypothetical protein
MYPSGGSRIWGKWGRAPALYIKFSINLKYFFQFFKNFTVNFKDFLQIKGGGRRLRPRDPRLYTGFVWCPRWCGLPCSTPSTAYSLGVWGCCILLTLYHDGTLFKVFTEDHRCAALTAVRHGCDWQLDLPFPRWYHNVETISNVSLGESQLMRTNHWVYYDCLASRANNDHLVLIISLANVIYIDYRYEWLQVRGRERYPFDFSALEKETCKMKCDSLIFIIYPFDICGVRVGTAVSIFTTKNMPNLNWTRLWFLMTSSEKSSFCSTNLGFFFGNVFSWRPEAIFRP